MEKENGESMTPKLNLVEILFVIAFLLVALMACLQPYNESQTYNRLTGAHTTWWDALWVELRVQDSPKHE